MEEMIANKVSAQDIYWNRPAGEEFDMLTLEKFFDTYVVEHVERRSTKSLRGEIFIPRSEVLQRKQDMQLFVYSRRKTTSSLTQTINRMKFVSPACGDLYYLRMLLRHYPSRSWVDARTANGNVHDTCHDACVAMSIVSNNTEFDVIMKEAIANLIVSDKLWRLFVMVLLQKYAQSKANFIKYAVYMSLDFYQARNMITPVCQGKPMMALLYQFTFYDMPYDIQQDLLQAIQEMFVDNNLEMEGYGLPLPKAPAEAELEKTKYNIDAITRMLDSVVLNREQKKIVKYIFRHTDNIFIDAPFGRGKSFLLDYILGHIRVRKSMIALAVAPTGVMAIARGGFTMHGIVKMDIEPDDADRLQYHVGDNSQRAALIRGTHYLIIEEGPNAHRRIWESLERACRDIRKNGSPFGGLRVITAGDFRQIPPPIKSCDD
ncbi:helicase [Fragilaria crotonensis]|nr:helicase [Fragilaria crotonensis]